MEGGRERGRTGVKMAPRWVWREGGRTEVKMAPRWVWREGGSEGGQG